MSRLPFHLLPDSAAIDPDGSVRAVLPAFAAGALMVDVQGYRGTTPYVRYGNYGVLLLAGISILTVALRRTVAA